MSIVVIMSNDVKGNVTEIVVVILWHFSDNGGQEDGSEKAGPVNECFIGRRGQSLVPRADEKN